MRLGCVFHFFEELKEGAIGGNDHLTIGVNGILIRLQRPNVRVKLARLLHRIGKAFDDFGIGLATDLAGLLLPFAFDSRDFGIRFVDDRSLQSLAFVYILGRDSLSFGNPSIKGLLADTVHEAQLGNANIDQFDPASE